MEVTTNQEALYGLPLTLQISEVLKEHLTPENPLSVNQIATFLIQNNGNLVVCKRDKTLLKKRIKNFIKSNSKAGLLQFEYRKTELENSYLVVTKFLN